MTVLTIHWNIGYDPRAPCFRPGLIAFALTARLLASSVSAFGAHDARHLTQQLKAQGREKNYQHTDQTFAALERETAEIYLALDTFTPV